MIADRQTDRLTHIRTHYSTWPRLGPAKWKTCWVVVTLITCETPVSMHCGIVDGEGSLGAVFTAASVHGRTIDAAIADRARPYVRTVRTTTTSLHAHRSAPRGFAAVVRLLCTIAIRCLDRFVCRNRRFDSIYSHRRVFTTRRDASAVHAVSVCPSVCHHRFFWATRFLILFFPYFFRFWSVR